jgi:hypothetical protein
MKGETMAGEWLLQSNLDGAYKVAKWNTQEGAIADRERLLKPRRIKDSESPTGFRTIVPIGWTAIKRAHSGA